MAAFTEMTTLQYTPALINTLTTNYIAPPRLPGVVVSQSIAATTPVKRGTTIAVTILSPSDIPIENVVQFVPPAQLQGTKLDKIIQIQKTDPTILSDAKDPAVLTDPNRKVAFLTKVGTALGKDLTTSSVDQVAQIITMVG
jgi:hypothetical protein